MAETSSRKDPFAAFRFELRIDDLAVAGFSTCTGLQLDTEVLDYNEGGLNTHVLKFPGRTKQVNLVLRRGIIDRDLWDWYFDLTQGIVKFRNLSVVVHDASGVKDEMVWQCTRAFPTKWVGPELNAMQSTLVVETLELCHEGLSRKK
jgi:phage tail-like protein